MHEDPLHALNQSGSLRDKLLLLHGFVQQQHPAIERMAVALYDQGNDTVKTFLAVDHGNNPLVNYEARLQDTHWLLAMAKSQEPRVINDFSVLAESRKRHVQALLDAGFKSSYTVPMTVNGHFFGFVFFNARHPEVFQEHIMAQLDMVGHMVSLLVYNERTNIRTLLATIKSALELTHYRDPETGSHLERMSRYARLIALKLAPRYGFDDNFIEHVYLFAPLHDLGKITTPDRILLKPGPLNDEEFRVMSQHPEAGRQLIDQLLENYGLKGVGNVDMLRNIALCHHEALDGSGYPAGLKGDAIPIEARIVTVADIFDALTSERPYKQAWSNADAAAKLRELAQSKLDAECVEALLAHPDEILEIQRRFKENEFG